jgi:hypothetical protein
MSFVVISRVINIGRCCRGSQEQRTSNYLRDDRNTTSSEAEIDATERHEAEWRWRTILEIALEIALVAPAVPLEVETVEILLITSTQPIARSLTLERRNLVTQIFKAAPAVLLDFQAIEPPLLMIREAVERFVVLERRDLSVEMAVAQPCVRSPGWPSKPRARPVTLRKLRGCRLLKEQPVPRPFKTCCCSGVEEGTS